MEARYFELILGEKSAGGNIKAVTPKSYNQAKIWIKLV